MTKRSDSCLVSVLAGNIGCVALGGLMLRWKNSFWVIMTLGILGTMTFVGVYHYMFRSLPYFEQSIKHPQPRLSIGVVDINKFKTNSRVFQKFEKLIGNLNDAVHKEILEKETKLRAEYDQFKKYEDETKEPTQEILRLKLELDKKHAALEKTFRLRKEEIERVLSNGLTSIKQTLKEIVNELGQTYGLNIILNKSIGEGNQMEQSIVLYSKEGLDLTNEVTERLDEKLITKNFQ